MEYQQVIADHSNEHQQHPRYGKMIVLCQKEGRPFCMLGPHYFVLIPAFLLICALLMVMYIKMFPLLEFHWKIILAIAIAMFLGAYTLVGLSNPGIVLKQLQADNQSTNNHQNDPYFCHICSILRQRGTRHCEFCDICIKGYDHHCPWIGKCVGSQNKESFYIFILMTFATMLFFFLATVSSNK